MVFLLLMQLNKSIKNFINFFLGPLLFCMLLFSIYSQVAHQPNLKTSWLHIKQSFYSYNSIYLVVVVVLMFVNWGLETWKWKISVRVLHQLSFLQAYKAVLSGVTFSVTTPNRIGEYLGRMIYMPEGKRLETISITIIGSFSQILVTFITGTVGFFVLKNQLLESGMFNIWYQFIGYGLLAVTSILTLFYFTVSAFEKWLEKWLKRPSLLYFVRAIQQFNVQLLTKLLLLSFIRYVVFMIQYILLFRLFEVDASGMTIFWIMTLVFLALAIIPTIVLVEIGIRGEITLQLMSLISANNLGVIMTSVTIWFINLILPAIFGSLLLLSIKVFKKNHETL